MTFTVFITASISPHIDFMHAPPRLPKTQIDSLQRKLLTIMERTIDMSVPNERLIHHYPMSLLGLHHKGKIDPPRGKETPTHCCVLFLKCYWYCIQSLRQDTNTGSTSLHTCMHSHTNRQSDTYANRCSHTHLRRDNCKPSASALQTSGKW